MKQNIIFNALANPSHNWDGTLEHGVEIAKFVSHTMTGADSISRRTMERAVRIAIIRREQNFPDIRKSWHHDRSCGEIVIVTRNFNVRLNALDVENFFKLYTSKGMSLNKEEALEKSGLSETAFKAMQSGMGLKKTSLPFSPAVTTSEGVSASLERVHSSKFSREQVGKERDSIIIREYSKTIKTLKDQEIRTEKIFEAVRDTANSLRDTYKPKILRRNKSKEPFAIVISPFDFHYGKLGWEFKTGQVLTKEEAAQELFECTNRLLDNVRNFNVEKFIVPVGSDFFHADNMKSTTTAGTPQDMNMPIYTMIQEGCELMVSFLDTLRQVAPVEIRLCAGNHDEILSFNLLLFLSAWYRASKDVDVHVEKTPNTYTVYGNNLLGFSHGDGIKMNDLSNRMAIDRRKDWGVCENTVWFTGHLHHTRTIDDHGTLILQMPSLSQVDKWHEKKGYYGSNRGMSAYCLHKERGLSIVLNEFL